MVTWTKIVYILLHAVAYKTTLVVYTHKINGPASLSNPQVFKLKCPSYFQDLLPHYFQDLPPHQSLFLKGPIHPVLDWCVICTGLVCCMYWTGVLYVLDWCVVCTGLVCCTCMNWTGHTSSIHQPSTYTSPVQHTSPVHNTLLHVLNWERGLGHCPCTLVKEEGWW